MVDDTGGGAARVALGVDGGSAGLLGSLLLAAPETDGEQAMINGCRWSWCT